MTTSGTYSKVAIWLHWLLALLIIGQIASGLLMSRLGFSSLKFEIYQWHKSFGLTVLCLSFIRLLWRLSHKPPALPDTMPKFQQRIAALTHIILYGFMIVMPLTGWIMVSASPLGIKTVLFKTIPWPHFPAIPVNGYLAEVMQQMHQYIGYGFIALLILHIGAALKHHFLNKDDILTRMLPLMKQRQN